MIYKCNCRSRWPCALRHLSWGLPIAEIGVWNLAEGMDACRLCLLCVVRVAASATSWSLFQRRPELGCCATEYIAISWTPPHDLPWRHERGIEVYICNLYLTSALVVGGWLTPRPGRFTSGNNPVPVVEEAGWTPEPVWTGAESLAPTEIRSPNRTARTESLYRLSYPGQYFIYLKKSSPVTGLEWPRGFQEVKVLRFHDNGTGRW